MSKVKERTLESIDADLSYAYCKIKSLQEENDHLSNRVSHLERLILPPL